MAVYDRPTLEELIDAARMHLEGAVIPAVKGDPKLYFQSLIAANILKIASRQVIYEWSHVRGVWDGLNVLEGLDQAMPQDADAARAALDQRQAVLCAAIRAGMYDAQTDTLLDHLTAMTRAQLEVANPKFLEMIDAEDAV